MIPTRTHGLIDYGVSAVMGGLAACSAVPPPIRRLLAATGAFHAGYAVLTDYEGGLYPGISMQRHLELDAAGAIALGGAALLMRRQPPAVRAALAAVAVAELAVVAFSDPKPACGPGQGAGPVDRLLGPLDDAGAGYIPLDTPKYVAPDVHIVDSVMPNAMRRVLPLRMTVLRLPDGSVLLHSPTPFALALKHALEQIGPIRHLVAPNSVHWMYVREWQRACPDAITWAAPGLRERRQVQRSGLRLDRDIPQGTPPEWGGAVGVTMVPGGLGFHEAALFHAPSRTLLLTDLVLNLEPSKLPAPARWLMSLFGSIAPEGMPPPYLRAVVRQKLEPARQAARQLLALEPERVIFAHGSWFERDGARQLRRAWRWLLD